MKRILYTALILSFGMLSASCKTIIVSGNSKSRVPPGQAKKINGDQSAKDYAPGQQKNKHLP